MTTYETKIAQIHSDVSGPASGMARARGSLTAEFHKLRLKYHILDDSRHGARISFATGLIWR
jgi:hypothetical protein